MTRNEAIRALESVDTWKESPDGPAIADKISRLEDAEIRAALAERVLDGTLCIPVPLLQNEFLRAAYSAEANRQLIALQQLDPWRPEVTELARAIARGPYRPDVRYEALKLLVQTDSVHLVDRSVREAVLEGNPGFR